MNYFEDLSQEATNALCELEGNTALLDTMSTAKLSAKMSDLKSKTDHQKPIITVKRKTSNLDYLFKISIPITPTILASAAILSSQPIIIHGEDENGVALFCQVNELDIFAIKKWLANTYPTVFLIFAPINMARKALSPFSAYPTLGYDTTVPHHRPQSTTHINFLPSQNQYPVWYFFYGTLADCLFLARLFGTPPEHIPALALASIRDGKLRKWGKYNALVDSTGSQVDGWACKILSKEQEDTLRMYETAKYEVVRVEIALNEGTGGTCVVRGCTFRFADGEDELN